MAIRMPDDAIGEGAAVIVVGDPSVTAEAAIDAIGARCAARIGWADVPHRLGRHSGAAVILVEAEGVDEAVLAAALPRIDAAARTLDAPVVIAFDAGAIDLVAAALLGSQTQLLCEPDLTERVAALAVAAEMAGVALVHDSWREGEAARLRRLNDEVARIADVLSRLTRRETAERGETSGDVADRRQTFAHEPGDDLVIDAVEVRRAIRSRRLRDQHFGAGLFEDPAWDMILDLFAADLERIQVSVSSLCIAAAVAPTTALRWIARMTDAGLFERHPDPFDRRRAFMALSARGLAGMRAYVGALRRAGLSLV